MSLRRSRLALGELLAWFEDCANNGERAPRNFEIACRFGWALPKTSSTAVHELERQGLIRVRRFKHDREVEIVATGRKTALDPARDHERPRPAAPAAPAADALPGHRRRRPARDSERKWQASSVLPDQRKQRRCLKCGGDFASAHAGNRLCDPCRDGNSGAGPGPYRHVTDGRARPQRWDA